MISAAATRRAGERFERIVFRRFRVCDADRYL